jgi:protein arginine kinase
MEKQKMSNRNPLLCNRSPWINNSNTIWLGSTVNLNRNLEKFKFPGKLAADKRKEIVSFFSKDILRIPDLQNPKLIKAEEMPPLEKEFLVEHFLSHQSFNQAHVGEAFVLDESGEFLCVLNLRDHLSLVRVDTRDEPEKAWDRLVKMETELNKSVSFAFSSRFGFLTSDPTLCGTGLIVYVFLHLPGLIYMDQLEDIIRKYKDDGIEQTGLQGSPNDIIGDIMAFHNSYTLGLTEESILSSLRALATRLVGEEKKARAKIKKDNNSYIKDRVSRAYAILLHSYQIEAVEALNAISLLKMGLDLEWLTGTSQAALNQLLFNCRRAHLLCLQEEKFNQEEIPHKRAEFIHQALKGVELHI